MLISFRVKPTTSMLMEQRICLIPTKEDKYPQHTFTPFNHSPFNLLKSVVIQGDSIYGKHTFIKSLAIMKQAILENNLQGNYFPAPPFTLHTPNTQQITEVEISFIASDEVRYHYGFIAQHTKIMEEWLYAFPKGVAKRWFKRKWNTKTQQYGCSLGQTLLGDKWTWLKNLKENQFFLSTAVSLGNYQLAPAYDWFKNTLNIVTPVTFHRDAFSELLLTTLQKGKVLCVGDINEKLSPRLIESFHHPESNAKNAQLLFTSKQPLNVLQEVFRQDQIWCCSSTGKQADSLYPLSEAKKGHGYLRRLHPLGRYEFARVIPYLHKNPTP